MRTIGVVLLALATVSAGPARAHERVALQREVTAAAAARDWCRALHYTELLESLEHQPRLVFNAAEMARAGDDLLAARAWYLALVERDPDYAKAPLARQGIDEVTTLIATRGPGTRCAVPAPRCGDGAVEGGEACDDGNTTSGDGCVADCSRAPRCGDSFLDADEVCDDGNTVDGDHCSSACRPELEGTPRPPPEPEPEQPGDPDVVVHGFGDHASPQPDFGSAAGVGGGASTDGSPLLAMGIIGSGVVGATTGVVSSVVGSLPLAAYWWQASIIDESTRGARRAGSAERYTYEVALTGAVDREMRTSMAQWNGSGRVITALGVSLLLVGTGAIIAGAMLYPGADATETEGAATEVAP